MKKKAKKKTVLRAPKKSGEIPVTKNLLDAVEQKLTSQLTSLRLETKAGFTKMDSRFESMEAKLSGMLALLEEQNARNRFVLDGYTSIHDKQISTDKRIEEIEIKVFGKEQD